MSTYFLKESSAEFSKCSSATFGTWSFPIGFLSYFRVCVAPAGPSPPLAMWRVSGQSNTSNFIPFLNKVREQNRIALLSFSFHHVWYEYCSIGEVLMKHSLKDDLRKYLLRRVQKSKWQFSSRRILLLSFWAQKSIWQFSSRGILILSFFLQGGKKKEWQMWLFTCLWLTNLYITEVASVLKRLLRILSLTQHTLHSRAVWHWLTHCFCSSIVCQLQLMGFYMYHKTVY